MISRILILGLASAACATAPPVAEKPIEPKANEVLLDGQLIRVRWADGERMVPADRPLRLEFEMKGVVDLYSFCVSTEGAAG